MAVLQAGGDSRPVAGIRRSARGGGEQLAAKDATVSQISNYFEQLVEDLNERIGRDAKTNLLNFRNSKRP